MIKRLFLLFLFFFISFSCKEKSRKISKPIDKPERSSIEKYSDNDSIVKTFVENFQPDSTLNGFHKMHNFTGQFVYSLKQLRKEKSPNSEKYLTLLYLKIYRGHLKCCHQSYELRKLIPQKIAIDSISDPVLFEYNLITKQINNSKNQEFISSGIAESWLQKNNKLLIYSEISKEISLIKKISSEIKYK